MEENTFPQAKLDLLEKQIDKIKSENGTPLQCKISWITAIWILVGIVVFIALGCWFWTTQVIKDFDNISFWIVNCITIVTIVSIVSILTYKLVYLVSSIEQRKSDSMMSIYKEREMLVINLQKSLASKVLDSITFENKKDGIGEREKSNESDSFKVKEQQDHEERMAIIKALGNNCSKDSISAIQEGIKDIQRTLKEIHR